ncbi:MAG: MinD/ParA family protein [Sedimentisphaerales bacterium]|nr:MinD/ParA family protein [Sedimentisphaerales bacterium]
MLMDQAVSFSVPDQAQKLRLMVRNARQAARVLAVTSGKGGVGKSNVAANLAICLAAAGKRVILMDADLGLANLDILLPVSSRANLSQVLTGKRRLSDILQRGPGGIQVICGASGISRMADLNEQQRQRILEEISGLEQQADIIVIDTGAGISPNVLSFCHAADHNLVITTPEPTSITDAYAVIKTLLRARPQAKLSLLVNMAEDREQAKMLYARMAAVTRKFLAAPIYDAGYIRRDDHLGRAVLSRRPVVLAYPRCPASLCLLALAQKLARAQADPAKQDGFFRRVLQWFR